MSRRERWRIRKRVQRLQRYKSGRPGRREKMVISFYNAVHKTTTQVRIHSNNEKYIVSKLHKLGLYIIPRKQIRLACYECVGKRTDPEHIIQG